MCCPALTPRRNCLPPTSTSSTTRCACCCAVLCCAVMCDAVQPQFADYSLYETLDTLVVLSPTALEGTPNLKAFHEVRARGHVWVGACEVMMCSAWRRDPTLRPTWPRRRAASRSTATASSDRIVVMWWWCVPWQHNATLVPLVAAVAPHAACISHPSPRWPRHPGPRAAWATTPVSRPRQTRCTAPAHLVHHDACMQTHQTVSCGCIAQHRTAL